MDDRDGFASHGAAPRWPGVAGTLVALAGVGVAAYLTYAHYTTASVLACSDHGLVNCVKVTTSSYSRIAGIPVALTGLVYFVVMAVLELPWMWRSQVRGLRSGRVLASAAGVALVMWLVYVELFRLDAICLYCTAVHCLTVALFIITAVATAWLPDPADPSSDSLADPEDGTIPESPTFPPNSGKDTTALRT